MINLILIKSLISETKYEDGRATEKWLPFSLHESTGRQNSVQITYKNFYKFHRKAGRGIK